MDEMLEFIDLLMGKPGIIAAATASFAALYQIWKIVTHRNMESKQKEDTDESNQDVIKTLMSVIEMFNDQPANKTDKKRIHDLLSHEEKFRRDLLNRVKELEASKRVLESEKKELREKYNHLTEDYLNLVASVKEGGKKDQPECPTTST